MKGKETNSLAARWLEDLFFSCAIVSGFLLWREIVLGVTYLPYQLCRCFFFWLRWESVLFAQVSFLVVAGNSFRCYLLTYHTSCAVVSAFWLQREIIFGCTVSKILIWFL
jgi:hypothetical protein